MRNLRPNGFERADLAWIVGLWVVGAALRWVHLATIRDAPFFDNLVLDALWYDEWARRIAAGDWLGDRPFFQDPLYAYVLGALYSVVGMRHLPVLAFQATLGAAIGPMLLAAARPWAGRFAARSAGVLAALYAPSIYYEGLILKTWLATFLVAVFLALLSVAVRRPGIAPWLVAGVVLGLACLTRGNLLLFAVIAALWVLLDARKPAAAGTERSWRDLGARPAALMLLGVAVVVGATTVRNRVAGGEWVLTTSNAGQNFYIGNNPYNTTGQYARLPFVRGNPKHEEPDFAREAERRTGRRLGPVEVSRFWFAEGVGWARSQPDDWLGLMWRKLRAYWGAYEIPDTVDYDRYAEEGPVLRWPLPGFGTVVPLGLLGLWLAARRSGWPRLLAVLVVSYSCSVVAFFVFSRFRMPMMPAMFVLAGMAVAELARRLQAGRRERRWAPFVRHAMLLVVLFALVNLPVRGRPDSPSYRVAEALGLPVRAESSANAHFNLAVSYAELAKQAADPTELLGRAETELRLAIAGGLDHAQVHIELGKVHARQGRALEAIEQYRIALATEPHRWREQHALGILYRRSGDLPRAANAFRRALETRPHAVSAVALGEALVEQGKLDEAAEAFRRALDMEPDNSAARDGLRRAGRGKVNRRLPTR